MRIYEKGRSMIEMLGVLAIVGVLSVGGIAGYSKAMAKYKMNTLLSQVSELTMNIRSLYMSQGDYAGMSERVVISAGVVPNGITVSGSSTLIHILNGNIRFFPSISVAIICSFSILKSVGIYGPYISASASPTL